MTKSSVDVSTFQGLILALQQFWADRGCVIIQPLDIEVGAGTFHPGTFLRAIGPESWNTAYVQPCRRPTDSRYGENPMRLQHYYQFQVLLKPSPLNIQELYLESLKHLGIDTLIHDIRFVEDNWESPTLGAWGLGWEVWLNGMEVTQFTYFQQVGGLECYPVSGEITYGIERIAMYLQGVNKIFDLVWANTPNGVVTYGDVFHQNNGCPIPRGWGIGRKRIYCTHTNSNIFCVRKICFIRFIKLNCYIRNFTKASLNPNCWCTTFGKNQRNKICIFCNIKPTCIAKYSLDA